VPDYSKCDKGAAEGKECAAKPSIRADRLTQEGVAHNLQKLGKWVELDDQMMTRRKEIRLPYNRCYIEQDCEPSNYELNDISIAYAYQTD
jgi:hypothetical protein